MGQSIGTALFANTRDVKYNFFDEEICTVYTPHVTWNSCPSIPLLLQNWVYIPCYATQINSFQNKACSDFMTKEALRSFCKHIPSQKVLNISWVFLPKTSPYSYLSFVLNDRPFNQMTFYWSQCKIFFISGSI